MLVFLCGTEARLHLSDWNGCDVRGASDASIDGPAIGEPHMNDHHYILAGHLLITILIVESNDEWMNMSSVHCALVHALLTM